MVCGVSLCVVLVNMLGNVVRCCIRVVVCGLMFGLVIVVRLVLVSEVGLMLVCLNIE